MFVLLFTLLYTLVVFTSLVCSTKLATAAPAATHKSCK